jgi:hypothetical protein
VIHHSSSKRSRFILLSSFLIGAMILLLRSVGIVTVVAQEMIPDPTPDPLEKPELPSNPTTADFGRVLYYDHCMPCHGDHGQGLTDEWREVWVDDHQNCWASGCHAGRPKDEGFPIPRIVPAVMGMEVLSNGLQEIRPLYTYLQLTHPPQYPGALKENEYLSLSVFVLTENGILEDQDTGSHSNPALIAVTLGLIICVVGGAGFGLRRSNH